MSDKPLRVCYFGTYRAEYSRNKIMIEGLRRNNVEVLECHETLWHSIEDRVQTASGGWRSPSFWWRVLRAYLRLIWHYFQTPDHDILIVGYPGQFDVYLARLLSWLRGKPLAWDIFMSIYLIALERNLEQRSPFTIHWIRRIERWALRLPDQLIHDTEEYAKWLSEIHGVEVNCFHLVPTGADDRIFQPAQQPRPEDGVFQVIYYGTFIPNHGVRYIIEAARYLAEEEKVKNSDLWSELLPRKKPLETAAPNPPLAIHFQPQAGASWFFPVKFELIGDGPDRPEAEALARQLGLGNVHFAGWMEPQDLIQRAAQADVCLGAFGTTPQSIMTVQNKIYEGLAMARPVVSGDASAVRQALKAGEQIYLCGRADGQSLADAIRDLYQNPALRQRLAQQGHQAFLENYSLAKIGARYAEHLRKLVEGKKRRDGK